MNKIYQIFYHIMTTKLFIKNNFNYLKSLSVFILVSCFHDSSDLFQQLDNFYLYS